MIPKENIPIPTTTRTLRRYALLACIAWTVLMASSLTWLIIQEHYSLHDIATAEARIAFQKDTLYRKWVAKFGGVYAPVSPESPPNPNLAHIPERDISTPSGKILTLINPAYMTRQVFEMADKESNLVKGHITSLRPIRGENAPDAWETKALKALEKGAPEVSEIQLISGREYMRFMRPFMVEAPCLKCHAAQGYVVGDMRGGVSVSVPMDVLAGKSSALRAGMIAAHITIWLLGLSTILLGTRQLTRSYARLNEQNQQLANEIGERETAQEQLQEQAALLEEEIAERQKANEQLNHKSELLEQEIITRKQAEDLAIKSQEHLKLIMDSTYAAIYGIDTMGACTFANKTCLQLLGYDRVEQVLGHNMHDLIHHSLPDGHPLHVSECKIFKVYRGGKGVTVSDEVFWRRDGTCFPVEYSSYPIFKDDTVIGAVISFIDISPRKQAQDALENLNVFNSQIVNSAREGIVVYDKDLRYLAWNPYMEELTAIQAADVLGKHPADVFPFLEQCGVIDKLNLVLAGENVEPIEFPFSIPSSGKSGAVSDMSSALRNKAGEIIGVIGIVRDVTHQRKLEMQLRHAQKLEAIGQLTGGIAHDFNNILTVIGGYTHLLQTGSDLNDRDKDMINQIAFSAERASSLTRSLLAFSHKTEMQLATVDLNEIVKGTDKFLRRIIGEDIVLNTSCLDERLFVHADRGQLEQILMNLAANSRDAMPDGGILTIETSRQTLDKDFVASHGFGTIGTHAVMIVSDTGCGMDEETRDKIFDPFFTTKGVGRGTGLGMSIVHGIVTQHNGHITVYSEVGVGTTFRIYIPIRQIQSASSTAPPEMLAMPQGSGTILLVEDDDGIRKLIGEILGILGYTVISAQDGEDGVRKFAEHQDSVALVLMDFIMPYKNGKQACDEIRQYKKDAKIIFMSGYTYDVFNSQEIVDAITDFIPKPIIPYDLSKKIYLMLNG